MTGKPQIRAACYCRISSDPRDKREGVDRQREDTADICAINGWTPVGVYVDNDRSATNGKDRPEWNRLLGDVEAGQVDAIVVWNQDRGWRNMSDLESLRPVLEPRGVLLATTNIGVIDCRNADDVFRAQVSTAMSEMEVAKMKMRMRRAARHRAERGVPQWKRAFGYTEDRTPDPVTAPLVKEMYGHVLAGGSLSGLARDLNDRGEWAWGQKWCRPKDQDGQTIKDAEVVCHRQPWSASTLSLFLRNPRNAALRAHNRELVRDNDGQVVRGTWAPLVEEDLWHAVQAVLNAPGRAPGRKSVGKHLLSGVMTCGKCGHAMGAQWVMQPTGGDPGRPKAGAAKRHSGEKRHTITYGCRQGCRAVSIRADKVEPLVFATLAEYLARPDAVDLLRDNRFDAAEAERLRRERAVLNARLDEIADERADGLLTRDQAARATRRIQDKLNALSLIDADQEKMRVLDGLPLGTPDVLVALEGLRDQYPDRLRAILAAVCTVSVMPVGRGRWKDRTPRDRLVFDWS